MSTKNANTAINTKQEGDCGYVCFSHTGQRFELYAKNMSNAIDLARAHCKPPKGKRHLVSAHLAELADGSEVVHVAVD